MGGRLESDAAFYAAVGAIVIAIFVVSVGTFVLLDRDAVPGPELIGLVVGFAIFMLVFFVSIAVTRLEEGEEL